MIHTNSIRLSIQSGNTRKTEMLVSRALRDKFPPEKILREGLAAGIMEAEKRYQKNDMLDSEYLICESALKAGLRILSPAIKARQTEYAGTVITGTLEGDIRETSKDLGACLMQSLGLKVIDLGSSISSCRFIEAAIEERAQIISCTTSLVIFLPLMRALAQAADQAKIRSRTKILLSGGPVTEWFCESINADMYAPDLIQASYMAADHCKKTASMRERPPAPNPLLQHSLLQPSFYQHSLSQNSLSQNSFFQGSQPRNMGTPASAGMDEEN